MRPPALDEFGLATALADYVRAWSERFDIHAELHVSGTDLRVSTDEVDTALYRIAQEALNNVVKHARARIVSVLFESHSDKTSLIIEDNGVGFDSEQAFHSRDKRFGLIGMRERATFLGGTLDVESQRGRGTTVVARIPTRRG